MVDKHSFKTISQLVGLASAVVVIAAVSYGQEILVPIALAILLSFLLAPVAGWLERLKLPRVVAVLLTVALAFSVIGGVGYVVYNQAYDFSSHLLQYKSNIQSKIDSFHNGKGFITHFENAGKEMSSLLVSPQQRHDTGAATQPATQPATQSTTGLANAIPVIITNPAALHPQTKSPWAVAGGIVRDLLGPVGIAVLVVVFTIFMLLEREQLRERFVRLMGRNRLTITTQALDEASSRVSRYLLAETIINGSEGVVVMGALWLVGHLNGQAFPHPAVWGLLTFLLRFVPYLGIWIAAGMPVLLTLAIYPSFHVALETAGAYLVIEMVMANGIEPFVLGANTGLMPLSVLVAAAVWTWLWGPIGLLLSTPMTVCLVVMGHYLPQLEFLTILLSDEPALAPPVRIYQRLLANDQEEADDLVHEYAAKMPLVQVYDEVLLPALWMVQGDRQRGNLDDKQHDFISQSLRNIIEELGDQHKAKKLASDAKQTVQQARGNVIMEPITVRTPTPATAAGLAGAPPAPPPYVLPKDCQVNVVCLPAHGPDDEIAALMLSQLLEMQGYCVTVISAEKLVSEMVETIERFKADAVCVSALPPAAIAHARYVCKRLHENWPELNMVAGLWKASSTAERARERIACDDRVHVTTTLAETLAQIHEVVQPRLMAAAASEATPLASRPQDRQPPEESASEKA